MKDQNDHMTDGDEIEADLLLLESHLDGALSPDESAGLLVRLSVDRDLAALLDGLRAERADRSAVWASLEPDDRAVDQLCWRVRGAVAAELAPPFRITRWGSFKPDPFRVTRFTAAAAACVMLGYFGGRLGQRGGPQSHLASTEAHVAPAGNSGGGGFTPVAVNEFPVMVPITDEYGNPRAYQRFTSAQARQFAEDLVRSHEPSAGQPVDGPVRTVSELQY